MRSGPQAHGSTLGFCLLETVVLSATPKAALHCLRGAARALAAAANTVSQLSCHSSHPVLVFTVCRFPLCCWAVPALTQR